MQIYCPKKRVKRNKLLHLTKKRCIFAAELRNQSRRAGNVDGKLTFSSLLGNTVSRRRATSLCDIGKNHALSSDRKRICMDTTEQDRLRVERQITEAKRTPKLTY